LEFQTLLRKRYSDKFHFSIGPYFYHYQGRYEDNNNKVLGKPGLYGLDSADIFSKKNYLGGKAILLVDNRNNDFFPTRGIHWNTELVSAAGIGSGSNTITRLSSDMRVYASMTDPANVVAVLGMGGGRIYSKNFEYFQAVSIGAEQNLQGFRKNRYMGRASMYGSLELKVKLIEIKSYLLPGAFGLTGFYNIGRVWLKDENSGKWHGAFGGGFYFMPFNLFAVTATAGFSKNERVFNFSIGTKVSLTY
jgi:outer membrane protein assembly factor BamA